MTGPRRDVGCKGCAVPGTCVLSGLDGEGLSQVERVLQRISYATGETIFHQGAPAQGFYILCQGLAKLYAHASQGRRVLFKFCRPGDLLAGVEPEYHAVSAISISESTVSFLAKDLATGLALRHSNLALAVGRRLAQDYGRLVDQMVDLAYENVRKRLVRVLLELGEEYGIREGSSLRIDLPLKLRDLADLAGCIPQTASEELHKLAKKGLVRVAWPTLIILDRGPAPPWVTNVQVKLEAPFCQGYRLAFRLDEAISSSSRSFSFV